MDLHYRFFENQSSLFQAAKMPMTVIDNQKLDKEMDNCEHFQRRSTFSEADYGPYMAKQFRFGTEYSWRVARDDERLHHHSADGSVCVALEQLKARLRFPMHRFKSDVVCVYFKCSISQITPNAIRAINWYIASCTALAKQPTLKAFFHLFNIKMSSVKPFVELSFSNKNSVIGRALGEYVAFDFPNSMPDWQDEFVVLSGGELPWMPNMVLKVDKPYYAPRDMLSPVEIDTLVEITKSLGVTSKKANFYENRRLQLYLRKCFNEQNLEYCYCVVWFTVSCVCESHVFAFW